MARWESIGGNVDGTPAAVSWGDGRIDLFARSSDNTLLHEWYDGGWGGWEEISGAGQVTTDPVAVVSGSRRLDVIHRGDDESLRHTSYDGNWETASIPATGRGERWETERNVSIVSWGPGRLDLFARTSSKLLHWWMPGGTQWAGPEELDMGPVSYLEGDIAAVSVDDERLDVIASDDYFIHHFAYDGGWRHFTSMSSPVGALNQPAVVSNRPGHFDLFVDTGTRLHRCSFVDNAWGPWGDYPGWGPLCAVSSRPGLSDVFASHLGYHADPDVGVWHTSFDDRGIVESGNLDGPTMHRPAAVSWGPERLDVFGCTLPAQLLHTWRDRNWIADPDWPK
jgi:hypothetical protein